jgi:MFS family permease
MSSSPAPHLAAIHVAIAATIANTLCMTAAISATIGVFLVPIATEFGWPRAAVSGVLGLISVISAIAYPLAGRAMDRFGSRWILLAGNVGLAAGIVLVSRSSASIDFYWRFAVAGLFGTMAATGMVSKIVSDWFDARRGLMLGITAGVGNGVGATIMPILAGVLLTFYGWRTAYLVIGLIVLLAAPFIAFWLREAPTPTHAKDRKAGPVAGLPLAEAVRTRAFWLMLVAIAAGAGGMTAMFTHVVPLLTGHGVSLAEATGWW